MTNLVVRSFLVCMNQVNFKVISFFSRNRVRFLLHVLLLMLCMLHTQAQTGPGGVGVTNGTSTLMYWIDASRQAQSLNGNLIELLDLSGNNATNTIIGTPVLAENYVNQRSAVNFNGIDQQILTDAYINAGLHPNLTVIAVYQPSIAYAGSVWGDYEAGWEGRYLTDNNFNVPRTSNFVGPGYEPPDGSHPSGSIPGLFTANQWVISAVVFREDVNNGTVVRVNGLTERVFTTNHNPGAYNQFTVGSGGSFNASYPFWYNGHVAELVVFNEALNELDLITIENYLSAKYNIALTATDLFTGDNNGFDFDVAGIGRIDAATVRLAAQGTGIVSIEAADIDVNEFLFWGHNNNSLSALETSDIPAGVEGRSNRVWRISEVNSTSDAVDIGSLNITFQFLNIGPVTASDLVLLIDTNHDGLFSDETPISGAYDLGNNNYQFQNISAINNGSNFTFGSSNISTTPLPITLLNFKVKEVNNKLLAFSWSTASELNNNYFEIMESKDAFDWQFIISVTGKGNSNDKSEYYVQFDDSQTNGRTYYKLRQVDFDGVITDLKIEKVDRDRRDEISLFPNPARTFITIQADEFDRIDIYDSRLKLVKTTTRNIVQVNDLAEGVYVLHIKWADRLEVRKLLIQRD